MSLEVWSNGHSLSEAYHSALVDLHLFGEKVPCPDWNTNQLECSMTMIVSEPLREPMISRLFIGGYKELQQYTMEMLDGILDFEIEAGNWTYTYHDRMKDQIPFVIDELKRNPYSRRAVISIRTPEDRGSDDPACLQHIQFMIRNGCLDMKVLFRSNDACKATFMNAFALIQMQKRIADILGVGMGTYTHRANSFHCYEKDYDLLDGYVKRIESEPLDMLTYDYVDEWDELMEDSIPEIMAQVDVLKQQAESKKKQPDPFPDIIEVGTGRRYDSSAYKIVTEWQDGSQRFYIERR